MRAQDAEQVRRLPLFRAMDQACFDTLIAAGYLQRFPAGVVLLHEGARPDFLHVLVDGAVEFFTEHAQRETTLSILMPPSAFIVAAVIVDDVYLKSARTLAASTVVLIPAEAVRAVFDKDTAFARATVVELAYRYRAVVKDLKNQRLRTGVQRLANWLVVQDDAHGRNGEFRIAIEKRVLAGHLGVRPENLSRAFAELQKAGIDVDGPVIRIRDRKALIEVAQPTPLIDGPERSDLAADD